MFQVILLLNKYHIRLWNPIIVNQRMKVIVKCYAFVHKKSIKNGSDKRFVHFIHIHIEFKSQLCFQRIIFDFSTEKIGETLLNREWEPVIAL